MMDALAAVRRSLSLAGADIEVSPSRRRIQCDLSRVGVRRRASPELWQRVRRWVYFFLNNFEEGWRVVVIGVPRCLFPDAEDHVFFDGSSPGGTGRIDACATCRFRDLCPGMPARLAAAVGTPEPVSDLPKEVVIEVSKLCNLRCRICFAGSGRTQPSREDITRLLDETRGLGIKSVRFTGGEPLLRPDIIHILEEAKSKGFYVLLNTNGTILPGKLLKALPRLVDNALISIQGHDHDSDSERTRSNFPFADKLKNISRLVDSGVGVVRLGTIVSRTSIDEFQRYADLVVRLGVKHWELYRPMMGRAALAANPDLKVSAADLTLLCARLYALRSAGINAKIANAFPFCLVSAEAVRNSVLLGAQADDGHSRIIYDSRGFFKPSYYLDVNLGTGVQEAWSHPFSGRNDSLGYRPAACRRCPELRWCLGGSRFCADEAYGSHFTRDPWMPLSPARRMRSRAKAPD